MSLNYDALSSVTPFYYKFSFSEIKAYYERIINESYGDMIIYFIPSLTGTNISLDEFSYLFENPKVLGVKFTSPDFFTLERIKRRFKDKLLFSGFDEMTLGALAMGADGSIGSTFNLIGDKVVKLYNLFNEGKINKARHIQGEINDFIEEALKGDIYKVLKAILKLKGVNSYDMKFPFSPITKEIEDLGLEIYKKYF